MLNGKYPLIIIEIDYLPDFLGGNTGLKNFVNEMQLEKVFAGIPLPITLNEEVTGIAVKGEHRSLNIGTSQERIRNTSSGQVIQRGVSNQVTITFEASTDNTMLSILLAMSELIATASINGKARFSYFNNSSVIIRGFLSNVTTTRLENEDKIEVEVTIEKPLPELFSATARGIPDIENVGAPL